MNNIDEMVAIPFKLLEMLSGHAIGGMTGTKTTSGPTTFPVFTPTTGEKRAVASGDPTGAGSEESSEDHSYYFVRTLR